MRDDILKSVQVAEDVMKKYNAIHHQLTSQLSELMSTIMFDGYIIDFTAENIKSCPWLLHAHTIIGNDRSAKRFMVAGPVTVTPNMSHIPASKWSCKAYPLNEKGKVISGRGQGSSEKTIKISGNLAPATLFDDPDQIMDLLYQLAEANHQKKIA